MVRVRQKGARYELECEQSLHASGLLYRLKVPLLFLPPRVANVGSESIAELIPLTKNGISPCR